MKKMFQVILTALIVISLSPATVHASSSPAQDSSILYENGYYIETIITEAEPPAQISMFAAASETITRTKTTYVKDANRNILWYVSVTATFTYDGYSAQCISCSHDAVSLASTWSIESSSSSRSGNSATATATAKQTGTLGTSHTYTESVTIQCSPSGVVS